MSNWDDFWSETDLSSRSIKSTGLKAHHKCIFTIYKKLLDPLMLKNPRMVELGCGSGELSARLLERYGGSVTLVDNSDEALQLSAINFKKHNLKAKFLKKDLFKLKANKKFDIVHSEGLIEHFKDNCQKKILEVHKRCAKKNGYVLISVPRPVWYYKIAKRFLELVNKWPFGYEKAIDHKELRKLLESIGLKVLKSLNHRRYSFALAKV